MLQTTPTSAYLCDPCIEGSMEKQERGRERVPMKRYGQSNVHPALYRHSFYSFCAPRRGLCLAACVPQCSQHDAESSDSWLWVTRPAVAPGTRVPVASSRLLTSPSYNQSYVCSCAVNPGPGGPDTGDAVTRVGYEPATGRGHTRTSHITPQHHTRR